MARKNYIPQGKSKIRQAILRIIGNYAESDKNITKKHIESKLSSLVKANFPPSQLKSGAKFIRLIRDKAKIDGLLLFPDDSQKHKVLTAFAQALDTGSVMKQAVLVRTPKYKYEQQAKQATKVAARDLKGKVMYDVPVLYVVETRPSPAKILGAYATASSARAAARAYIGGMKKAYDPLIPTFTTGKTKAGNVSRRRDKLKIVSALYTEKNDGKARAGEADFMFENNAAFKYLQNNMGIEDLSVKVVKVTNRNSYRSYWKLFNSPSVGKMRFNPKR